MAGEPYVWHGPDGICDWIWVIWNVHASKMCISATGANTSHVCHWHLQCTLLMYTAGVGKGTWKTSLVVWFHMLQVAHHQSTWRIWTTTISEIATVTLNVCVDRVVSETGGGMAWEWGYYICALSVGLRTRLQSCVPSSTRLRWHARHSRHSFTAFSMSWYGALHHWNDLNKYFDVEVNSFLYLHRKRWPK